MQIGTYSDEWELRIVLCTIITSFTFLKDVPTYTSTKT